jgi:hypothetical protein
VQPAVHRIANAADQRVVAVATIEHIGPQTPIKGIVAGLSIQRVVAGCTVDGIVPQATADGIVCGSPVERIVSARARNDSHDAPRQIAQPGSGQAIPMSKVQ